MKEYRVPLMGNGDFRSAECLRYLTQADIVVTNPPFSLFREYIAVVSTYHKDYLLVGPMNAISYSRVFREIVNNRLWIGTPSSNPFTGFIVPDGAPTGSMKVEIVDGQRIASLNNCTWFVTLDTAERHIPVELTAEYSPEKYPRYIHCKNAIHVDKTENIPKDWFGPMGVPVSFLGRCCPEQFQVIGVIGGGGRYNKGSAHIVGGEEMFKRILIKRRDAPPQKG